MARGAWEDHFVYGGAAFGTSASSTTPWRITETGSSTVYTAGFDNGTSAGNGHFARIGLEATSEIQNVCLSFGDVLMFNIDDEPIIDITLRLGQSALDTTTSWAAGIAGDRNDAIDSIAQHILMRGIGSVSTTAVYYESDDGTTDTDDQPTSQTLTTGWKQIRIDCQDKSQVQIYFTNSNGVLIPVPTTVNVSAWSGCFQPYFQIQKTADTNTDYMDICKVRISFEEN